MHTAMRSLLVLGAGIVLMGTFGTTAQAGGKLEPDLAAASFSYPTTIDNPYWPLVPGTTFVYHTVAADGCEVNDVHVTDTTEPIAGVMSRQVLDQVYEDDNCDGSRDFLAENTHDWYAQDDDGNVWYMGEDTADYCDRDHPDVVCSTEGSWMAGVDGGEAGFLMLADPTPGTSYPQEYLEGEAEDMGKVLRTDASVSLTFDNNLDQDEYQGCLITKEWSTLEKGAISHKYYCPGIGNMGEDELQSGTVRTELFDIVTP